ncbi:MAG: hypothetical protein ABI083_11840 [Lapillicoccus sp.]
MRAIICDSYAALAPPEAGGGGAGGGGAGGGGAGAGGGGAALACVFGLGVVRGGLATGAGAAAPVLCAATTTGGVVAGVAAGGAGSGRVVVRSGVGCGIDSLAREPEVPDGIILEGMVVDRIPATGTEGSPQADSARVAVASPVSRVTGRPR